MSYDALGVSDAMLDSLSLQLREAEARRAEAERAHQEALAQLRGMTSGIGRGCSEPIETLQSRARELEKKAALETVRCEELQLELSAAIKSRNSRPVTTSSGISSTVTWAPMTTQGSEIDKIMAKIEQARLSIANDNRILAELEHPRTTGPTLTLPSSSIMSSGITGIPSSSIGGMPSSMMTSIAGAGTLAGLTGTTGLTGTSGLTGTAGYMGLTGVTGVPGMTSIAGLTGVGVGVGVGGVTGGIGTVTGPSGGIVGISGIGTNSIGITSSISSHAITSIDTSAFCGGTTTSADKVLSGTSGVHVSPLPGRAHPMTTMPPLSQSTTMPVLSLHNSYNLPSGSASYSLGLSGAPVMPSYTHPSISGVVGSGVGTVLGTGLTGTSTAATSIFPPIGTLPSSVLTSALPPGFGVGGSTSYTTYSNPILTSKLKPLDEIDLGVGRFGNRASSPCSPIPPPSSWGLDGFSDSVNPSYMPRSLGLGGLDLETRTHGYPLNGTGEPQVDMLDIPGKGRCCVFIARFSYDPPEESEGELSLCAGDYLLVWGNGEPQGGYYDAELLDGRRGLVPASFVQRLIGDDLLEFHQAVLSTLRDADDLPLDPAPLPPLPPNNPLLTHTSEDMARLSETQTDLGPDQNEDDADTVPAPKHLTLERQLNKSVLIGWTPAEPPGFNNIESYHVYVDGVLKVTVKANERTRALVEGVDSNRPHRISVRSVTQNRRTSRDAACTMIIGRDTAHLGPSAVRATNITCSSAVISWLPANSNHQHVVCVNNVEVRTVKPGVYRHTITGLAPSTQYRVTVRAKHLRAPGQAPPPGPPPEEAPGAYTDFRTLAKGLPDPPQDIQVEAGPQDGTLLVTWQPVNRPPSSGPVTGYAVYADGKKVTDVDSPTGDHALIDIGKLVGLNPRAVTVRTKSRDSQSSDSAPTPIPNVVRNAARNRHNVAHSSIPTHMRNQQRIQQMAPNQMQGGPMQGPGQVSMPGQMQGQQQQIPGQMSGQMPGQMSGQMSNQMSGQMPGQMSSQMSGQLSGQMSSQMSGQLSGQMTGQMSGQMPGQMSSQMPGQMQGQMPMNAQQQQIIEHEENLSDKEVFPSQMHQQQMVNSQPRNGSVGSIPAIEITKDGGGPPEECQFVGGDEIEYANMNRRRNAPANSSQHQQTHHQQQQQQGYQSNAALRNINDRNRQTNPTNPNQPYYGPGGPQQQVRNPNQRGPMQPRGPLTQQQQQQKKPRYFVAMFDYDPSTMSPNPDGCEEELPFQEGDTIKVYGDKDPDGFYWGELRGRRGYVPHNMVTEVDETGAQGGPSGTTTQSVRGLSRDRWGDIYANMPVKRMIALYDYDPQELSPNVDAEQVELSFKTGEVILVYGDMDEDGFYMGELDGVRGLVPSNFLAEAPEQYNNQTGPGGPQAAQRNLNNRNRPQGPGARGPAPPSTSNMMPGAMNQRGQPRKDARPTSPTLLDNTGHPAPDHQTQGMQGKGGMIGRGIGIGGNMGMQQQQQQPGMMQQGPMQSGMMQQGMMQQGMMQQGMQQQSHLQQQMQQQPPPTTTQQSSGGLLSGATSLFSGATQAASSGLFGTKQPQKGVPQVIPQPGLQPMNQQQQQQQQQQAPMMGGGIFGGGQQQQQQQQQPGQGPNLMQKINEITAPGGDILSKGKELIFMKFGLGGK